jgi:hypothetical protein
VRNGHVATELGLGIAPTGFKFAGVADVNYDGTQDVLFQNASGAVQTWEMQNAHISLQASADWLIT